MYYFTYQTKNLLNNKTYIGVHKTKNINDGYLGCGVFKNTLSNSLRRKINNRKSAFPQAILKYGVKNFKRKILCFFDTYEEALEEEMFLVNKKWIKSKDNYNVSIGGNKGCYGWKMPEEQKKKLSNKLKGRYVSEETKLKISKSNKGKPKSKEHKEKLSKIKTKYDLKLVYKEIKPLLKKGFTEKMITGKTGYSKGTIYRAKQQENK